MKRHRTTGHFHHPGWTLLSAAVAITSFSGFFSHNLGLAAEPTRADIERYGREVKPLLVERCLACHGALKQEGGLRLDTAAFVRQGGDSGPAAVSGKSGESLLIHRISAKDEADRMPPEGEPLTTAQVAAMAAWINSGLPAPVDEQPESDPRQHWAFQPIVRPALPPTSLPGHDRNPIDQFLAAEMQSHGLQPQSEATRPVWLRRVSLDLVGLPPTAAEMQAFLEDSSPEAHARVVDRLLNSPQYGERWGRHWMDIWRYSDWWGLGAEVRNSQKHMWHWRDWIVESLNADKGYDQMLQEMLAADELYPTDLDKLRATGFLSRQYFKFNRTSWLDGVVEHTAKSMLGLTMNCAKCHDHKYDPLSHQEYYQFRAIFEPYQLRTDMVAGELDFEKNGIPRAFDCNLDAVTYLHLRGDDRNPDLNLQIVPGLPAVLPMSAWVVQPVNLPAEAYYPGLRADVVAAYRTQAEQRVTEARRKAAAARQRWEKFVAPPESSPAANPASATAELAEFRDSFANPDAARWQQRAGLWSYADGELKQADVGPARTALRYLAPVPEDFEAELKFVPVGGQVWKSVGIAFDIDAEGDDVLAYVSAHAPGSKAQISYQRGGKPTYPADGARALPVELGRSHTLLLQVRGQLVNVTVDGVFAVAYQLPQSRTPGQLELVTFDAEARFQSFRLSPLADRVQLKSPSTKSTTAMPTVVETREGLEAQWKIAERNVATAVAEQEALELRIAADRAVYLEGDTPNGSDSVRSDAVTAAARAEAAARLAKAEEELYRAEVAARQADDAQRATADKQTAAAAKAVETARQQVQGPGEKYTPLLGSLKTLESNVESAESRSRPFPQTSTGRRAALAKWLTDRQNPLTARVAVNHLWTRHFGTPLVATVFDFGRKGSPPTHPQLLDWLSAEFMEQRWSMKHLHRLMVLSEAYRRTSSAAGADTATLANDPENHWYWRANPRRMEAQVVRDSLLHLAGELDLKLGGPSIPVREDQSRRRALYFVHSNNDQELLLSMFDDANVLDCYRRAESIVPQQALALENSALAFQMATKIAEQLSPSTAEWQADPVKAAGAFVGAAHQRVLSIPPTAAEQELLTAAVQDFIGEAQAAGHANAVQRGQTQLILVLLNHNDFVTIR